MSDNQGLAAPDMAAIDSFWKTESGNIPERNRRLAADFLAAKAKVEERRAKRCSVVFTCMDERCALVEDSLGLLPGEALVHASGGGRLPIDAFNAIFGPELIDAKKRGATSAVWLVMHECAGEPTLGCAAFSNDVEAQTQYFNGLKSSISEHYPEAFVHVLMLDTSTYNLKPISTDERDPELASSLKGINGFAAEQKAHAAYGVYVGDAYRAWVDGHNKYFRLSPLDPKLADDFAIALKVMGHHSTVDLSRVPVVLHVDLPKYANEEDSFAAKDNVDLALAAIMGNDEVKVMMESGRMRLVRTETDMGSWAGKATEG